MVSRPRRTLAGRRSRGPPPRQTRRCRRRFRTTATGQVSAPSIGSSRTLRPGWAPPLRCSRARPRPAPCCSLRAWDCLVKGLPVASSYPAHLRAALRRSASRRACAPLGWCGEKDASHRLLQPTPVTSTLRTAVFPVAPLRRSPPCGGSRRFERRLTLGRSRAARDPWGDLAARVHGEPAGWSPCLTAGLQLRRAPQPSREPPRGSFSLARELCPGRRVRDRARSW